MKEIKVLFVDKFCNLNLMMVLSNGNKKYNLGVTNYLIVRHI